MKKKILFITGSLNQTSQMHQIASHLPAYDCRFSQIFSDSPVINLMVDYTPWLDRTILAGDFRHHAENYLKQHNLDMDYKARQHRYDLVVYCSDMIIPKRMTQVKTIWVQEGMIDPFSRKSKIVKSLRLPAYFAGDTSLNGTSNICDLYCVASHGYRDDLISKGTNPDKIRVTGMPNFDNLQRFAVNSFPFRDYVMVATSDIRETFRTEDRVGFIRKAVSIAAGRQLLFKLHPNELYERASREIKENTPAGTMVYQSGNTNEMIANCQELITQYSTVVYVGLALGKKVHSYFDVNTLKRLAPLQNGGTSAGNIADLCRDYITFKGKKADYIKQQYLTR
jgi:hypothetical protein